MKVAIAGAGAVGRSIARELLRAGHSVMLLERQLDHIDRDSVPEAIWVHADACELALLEDAGLEGYEVVIAATGDDKANLVHSLLAKTEFGVRRVVARAVHGREAGNPAARDLRETEALLPGRIDRAAVFSAALMELGATVCTARTPDCSRCPLPECAWVSAGRPVSDVVRKTQKYEGTDRQARGRLLDVLRDATGPVERIRLDLAWTRDPGQRDRALDSLLVDGLIEQTPDGLFALAGEG